MKLMITHFQNAPTPKKIYFIFQPKLFVHSVVGEKGGGIPKIYGKATQNLPLISIEGQFIIVESKLILHLPYNFNFWNRLH